MCIGPYIRPDGLGERAGAGRTCVQTSYDGQLVCVSHQSKVSHMTKVTISTTDCHDSEMAYEIASSNILSASCNW